MNSIDGSGNVITQSREVRDFSGVSLVGSGEVTIDRDGTESLTITTDDNLLPYLTSQVSGGRLVLGVKKNVNLKPTDGVHYKITVKSLDQIDLAGSGSIDADGLKTERLQVTISGSGKTTVAGTADHEDVVISGSGDHDGEALPAKNASVRISGSGSALVAVSDKLDANISGSGSIKYIGDPTVTKRVTGSGAVGKE